MRTEITKIKECYLSVELEIEHDIIHKPLFPSILEQFSREAFTREGRLIQT